ARHPEPADVRVVGPAAVVIDGPGERLVRNEIPAVAVGVDPMPMRIRPPVAFDIDGHPDITVARMADPPPVVAQPVEEQADRNVCLLGGGGGYRRNGECGDGGRRREERDDGYAGEKLVHRLILPAAVPRAINSREGAVVQFATDWAGAPPIPGRPRRSAVRGQASLRFFLFGAALAAGPTGAATAAFPFASSISVS